MIDVIVPANPGFSVRREMVGAHNGDVTNLGDTVIAWHIVSNERTGEITVLPITPFGSVIMQNYILTTPNGDRTP